jgi:hypothetical protein
MVPDKQVHLPLSLKERNNMVLVLSEHLVSGLISLIIKKDKKEAKFIQLF